MSERKTISYGIRLPVEWEARLEALRDAVAKDPPPDLLRVTVSGIVREAYRRGMTKLREQHGGNDGR